MHTDTFSTEELYHILIDSSSVKLKVNISVKDISVLETAITQLIRHDIFDLNVASNLSTLIKFQFINQYWCNEARFIGEMYHNIIIKHPELLWVDYTSTLPTNVIKQICVAGIYANGNLHAQDVSPWFAIEALAELITSASYKYQIKTGKLPINIPCATYNDLLAQEDFDLANYDWCNLTSKHNLISSSVQALGALNAYSSNTNSHSFEILNYFRSDYKKQWHTLSILDKLMCIYLDDQQFNLCFSPNNFEKSPAQRKISLSSGITDFSEINKIENSIEYLKIHYGSSIPDYFFQNMSIQKTILGIDVLQIRDLYGICQEMDTPSSSVSLNGLLT